MSKKKEETKVVKGKKTVKRETVKKNKTVAEKKEPKTVKVKKVEKKTPTKKEKPVTEKKAIKKEEKPIKKKEVTKKETVKEEKIVKKEEKKASTKRKTDNQSLSKKEQKNLKVLSKIVCVIAKIIKVCAMIIVPILAVVAILIPILFSKVEVNGNIVKIDDLRIVMKDDNITVSLGEKTHLIGDKINNLDKVIDFLNDNELLKIMISVELFLIFSIVLAIINIYLLTYAEKLFGNFVKDDTPFTEKNSNYVRSIGKIMIISLIVAIVFETVLSLYTKNVFTLHIASYSVVTIMIVYILYYIFKYAVKLQKKSNDKVYD